MEESEMLISEDVLAVMGESKTVSTISIEQANETADNLISVRKKIISLKKELDALESDREMLEMSLSTMMITLGIKSIKREDGVSLISLQKSDFYMVPEKKIDFFAWLKQEGKGGVIKEDINYKTLQSFIAEEAQTEGGKYSEIIDQKFVSKSDHYTVQVRGLRR